MWQTKFITGKNPSGKPIISVLAKKTYAIKNGEVACDAQVPIPLYDSDLYDDPENCSFAEVIAQSDLIPFKKSTDVVILGKVTSPGTKLARYLDCDVTAGPYKKCVRAYGKRILKRKGIRGIALSEPEPFKEVTLGYKNAYGGVSRSKDGTVYVYYPNPIGKGFNLKGGVDDVAEIEVPNLEDPNLPLRPKDLLMSKFTGWTKVPAPVSLGWTRKNFYPRYTLCGVIPEQLQGAMSDTDNAGSLNTKADFDFFQGASVGLWGKRLSGDEIIKLTYMDSQFPLFETALPAEIPVMLLDTGDGANELEPFLDTVTIIKDQNLLTVLWRGSSQIQTLEEINGARKIECRVSGTKGNRPI